MTTGNSNNHNNTDTYYYNSMLFKEVHNQVTKLTKVSLGKIY